jgi:hypothetical protein
MTSQNHDNNGPDIVDETKTSTTENLQHLSQQLKGHRSSSMSSTNRESLTSAFDVKNLESRYQQLVVALNSSYLTNDQLRKELEELKPQHQDTLNHLEKEKKECQQALEEE